MSGELISAPCRICPGDFVRDGSSGPVAAGEALSQPGSSNFATFEDNQDFHSTELASEAILSIGGCDREIASCPCASLSPKAAE